MGQQKSHGVQQSQIVLHLEKNNPTTQYRLGVNQMESSFSKNDFVFLADHETTMYLCSKKKQASWRYFPRELSAGQGT